MPKRILYSCLSRSWGGMEMRTISGIEQLNQRGIQTDLLCYPGSRIFKEGSGRNFNILTAHASGYFHPLEIIKIAKIFKKKSYDIIHTQASHDLWLFVPALKLLNSDIPLVLTKRVGSFIVKKDFLHRKLYERVNVTIAISEVIKKNLMDTTVLTAEKIVLLHNGIDLDKFNPRKTDKRKVRDEFNIEPNEIVIGMLGRFSWGKGHEEFLFAARELTKQYSNLKFFIVGEPSVGEAEYADTIKKLSRSYGLDESVIFTGYRSDTPDILAAMDIFAFPSHSEAFGQSLVEAMAMGIPSVCSNSDGILDIAVDGVTSYLFERRSAEDFTKKLKMLIDSKQHRAEFGVASVKRAKENFEMENQINKLIQIYEKMISLSGNV